MRSELTREAIFGAQENPVTLRMAGYALACFAEKNGRAFGDDLAVATLALVRLEEAKTAMERLAKIIPDTRLCDVKPLSNPPEYARAFLSDLRKAG